MKQKPYEFTLEKIPEILLVDEVLTVGDAGGSEEVPVEDVQLKRMSGKGNIHLNV